MRKLLKASLLALALTSALGWGAFAASMTLLGAGGPAASYVGPGDVVAMTFWVGMRAYSAATRGQAAVNVCSESGGVDVTCEDELTSTTTGNLVLGTVGSTCGSITCTVKTWYDQTGNNFCSSSPCNFTQSTVADRATFNISCSTTSYPCASFNGTSDFYVTGGTGASSFIPHSVTAVANNVTAGDQPCVFVDNNNLNQVFFNLGDVANNVGLYDGPDFSASALDGSWHAIQGIFNSSISSGSELYVDGSATTGTLSGSALTRPFRMGQDAGGGAHFGGKLDELGVADNVVFTGTQNSNMNANQHAFYGF